MVEMKYSWTKWLGNIPQNWKISKISSIYTQRKTKVNDRDYPPLSVTMQGIVPQLETAAKSDAHDDRKLVKKWDFAINSRSDRRWSCWISSLDWSVSLINTVMQPKEQMNPWYYNRLFHTKQFADEFYKWWHWIVDDLRTTNRQDMKHIDIPVPWLDFQKKISDFLDKKISDINLLVLDIENEIEKLNSLRRSIITETITTWLNKNIEWKKCNIKWIEKIPSHRKEIRFYSALTIIEWQVSPLDEKYKNMLHVWPWNIEKFNWKLGDCLTAEQEWLTSWKYLFDNNCIIYWKINPQLGKVCIPWFSWLCSADAYAFKAKQGYNLRFIFYCMLSHYFWNYTTSRSMRMWMPKVNREELSIFRFAVPPIKEQREIVEYLDKKFVELDKLIENRKKQLDILEQYKESLIYEYTTGKKEVPSNY